MSKELTSNEVDEILKEELPQEKERLKELHEQVRKNMHGGYAETQSYKQRLDFLRSIEFRLQWQEMQESNKKMFIVALLAPALALLSVFISFGVYKEAIKSNQIDSQPFLSFLEEYQDPFHFTNEGNGPALNIILIFGNNEKEIFITKEANILSALSSNRGQNIRSSIQKDDLVKTSLTELKIKVPFSYNHINNVMQKNLNWVTLIYEDLYGNKFGSTIYGIGGEYSQAIEFIKF